MIITKEISKDNELYLYMNGELIYKKWLNTGYSKVFDVMAYDKYTYASYTDLDIENSPYIINVNAKLRLKTTTEGGRKTGIKNGYRPNHVFEYKENNDLKESYMGEIKFEGNGQLELGIEYEVIIRFPLAQRIERFMEQGRKWWIHEGPIVVSEAEILNFNIPENSNKI